MPICQWQNRDRPSRLGYLALTTASPTLALIDYDLLLGKKKEVHSDVVFVISYPAEPFHCARRSESGMDDDEDDEEK